MTRHIRGVFALHPYLLYGAFLATLSGASVTRAQEKAGGRPLVRAVNVQGVASVDRDALLMGLATRPTECKSFLYTPVCWVTRSPLFALRRYLDPVEMRRDEIRIRLFYWRRGFRDAVVTSRTEAMRGGVRVIFNVDEKDPTIIESLEIKQADSVLSPSDIASAVQLRAKEPLDLVAMDSSLALLREALWERGYADARIALDSSGVSNERNAGPVIVTVQPGPRTTVKEIEVSGNEKVTDHTIHRLLRFKTGDLYRRSDVLETQRELYLSGLFKEVEIGAQETEDSAKTIALNVTEAGLRQLNLAGGFTTADFLQVEAEYTRYNFLGSARRLTVRGTVSNLFADQLNGAGIFYDVTNGASAVERARFLQPTWAASVDFTQPWFFSAHNQLGASIFTHRRSIPGVVTDKGGGATIALTRDLGARSNATLGYTYEASRIDASDVYFCVAVGLCVKSAIRVIADRHPLSPFAFVAQYDGTNDPFTPNRGVRARLDLEHASRYTGSDFEYNRAYISASTYRRTSKHTVIAGRLKLGWVAALSGTNDALGLEGDTAELVVHPRKQFFSGGSQSVRGYGENQLGPRVLTIDPTALTDTNLTSPCSVQQLQDGSCDPNLAGVSAGAFQPRPLGGSSLAEASVEFRFPLRLADGLTGALFIDGAIVGTKRFSDLLGATATITPGFGIRFDTPVGPVRLDLGIRPRVVEVLPVITQVTAPDGSFQLVTLKALRRYNQAEATAGGGTLGQILSRLTLHLAIGPAF